MKFWYCASSYYDFRWTTRFEIFFSHPQFLLNAFFPHPPPPEEEWKFAFSKRQKYSDDVDRKFRISLTTEPDKRDMVAAPRSGITYSSFWGAE